ncbi:DUF4843 domain-containing protein [Pedobacter nyackensis]|uniref:DUF4843 domain-containing protein n=1 Tax=Pedobacter nyackensis TaxID=475255 RepID=UPI00293196C5|nr:DUF4843 domain-containing protein [Pedobacter nyackensis]
MLITVIGVMASCKKESLTTYDNDKTGSSIYFKQLDQSTNYRSISFGYVEPFKKDSIVNFIVTVTGKVYDHDREYKLEIADSSTMVAGVDYDLLNTRTAIKAGKIADTLRIKLHRNVKMASDSLSLYLSVKPNEHFTNNLEYREKTVAGEKVKLYYNWVKLSVDDIVGAPYFWDITKNANAKNYIGYLGSYSALKFQLCIQRFKWDVATVTKTTYMPSPTLAVAWGNNLKAYLDYMSWLNTPIYEADGVTLMKAGTFAK